MRKIVIILSAGLVLISFLFVVIFQEILTWIAHEKALDREPPIC